MLSFELRGVVKCWEESACDVLSFLLGGGRDGLANGRGRVWWVCESVLVLVRWEVLRLEADGW